MKINKKQIVMLTLSLVVCLAVYLNWRFLQESEHNINNESIISDDVVTNTETEDESNAGEQEGKILGEAQYVSSTVTNTSEYFTNSRLTRSQSKVEAIDLLTAVVSNESSSAASIEKANAEIAAIAAETELEGTVESLIKAKGFEDCVVFISSDLVNVIVQTEGLTKEQAAQINEIVVSQTGISASKIKIVEVN